MAKYEKFGEWNIHRSKFWGDKIVFPIKNDDGSFNLFNFVTGGSWGKLLIVSLIVFLVLFTSYSYVNDIKVYREVVEKCINTPCEWCQIITQHNSINQDFVINISQYDWRVILNDTG